MEPDKYQQAWRAQSDRTRVTVAADLLAKEVQSSHRTFRSTIFRRDFLEVGVALFMIPVWFVLDSGLPWTWYLTVPVLLWIAGFILIDRIRHPQLPIEAGDSLLESVGKSLKQVEHQIWLLRNIFWWYLLPPSISIMTFFIHVSWLSSSNLGQFFISASVFALILAGVYGVVYFVNQRAVRVQLEPRQQELLSLFSSLQDEAPSEDSRGATD